jgi:hypothetical protein
MGAIPRALLALLVFAALLGLPAAAARADEPPEARCSARVHAWVADAGRAAGVAAYAVACGSDRVKLRLAPEGAAPLDVEVTRSAERAFRRVGELGVSPILQASDFQQVPAARREPFERLAAWIEQHPEQVAFGGGGLPDAIQAPLARVGVRPGTPWLLAVALVLVLAARLRAAPVERGDRWAALGLFVVALPLRLALGAWGPLRINGLGPLWIMAAAVDPAEAGAYGPGYAEIFSPLSRLPLAPDDAIFAANGVISALLPPLLFALARLLGVDRRRALVVAFALALDPVSIRIATTESYVPVIAALAAAAAVAAAAAALEAARRRPRRAACLALAAGLFCAQAARVHPAAWIPVALAPLAAAGGARLSLRARLGLGLGALALCGATVVLTSAAELLHAYESMLTGETMAATWLWPRPDGALVLATLAALVFVARPRWPLALAALGALALASVRDNYAQSALWQASFDRLYLVTLLAGAAVLIPRPLARTRAFVPAAAIALLALFARRAPGALAGRTTDHEEYRWARRWLRDLPPSCRVAYVAFAGRRNLFLPTYATSPPLAADAALRLDGREPIDARLVLGEPRCTYYVRTSLCTSAEGRPVCADVERQLVLEPVTRASFAAVPSNKWLVYDREGVESVVSRVVGIGESR